MGNSEHPSFTEVVLICSPLPGKEIEQVVIYRSEQNLTGSLNERKRPPLRAIKMNLRLF